MSAIALLRKQEAVQKCANVVDREDAIKCTFKIGFDVVENEPSEIRLIARSSECESQKRNENHIKPKARSKKSLLFSAKT